MTRAVVYLLVNTSNGKKYVGKTKKTLAKRWEDHCRAVARGSKYAIHRAIRKYGQNVFTREVLGEYRSEAKALAAEKRWIAKLKTMGAGGYNMCAGGRGAIGYRMTAEARVKLRNFAKGRDMSAVLAKSIESRKKNGLSAKAKANISAAQRKRHREHPISVETRRKLSVANKGRQNYWLVGVPRTEEAKLKMSLAKKKQNAKRRHKPHTAIEKKKIAPPALQTQHQRVRRRSYVRSKSSNYLSVGLRESNSFRKGQSADASTKDMSTR